MFGRDWESADAKIVARRLVDQWHGGEGGHMSGRMYEYIADVSPDGAEVFRVTVKTPMNAVHFRAPDVGQVVRVKFRAKDRHVKFDHADAGTHQDLSHRKADRRAVAEAGSAAELARFAAIADAAPGSQVPAAEPRRPTSPVLPSPDDTAAAHSTDAEIREANAALKAASARATEAVNAFLAAKSAGDHAEAERLKGPVQVTNDEVQRLNAEYQRLAALRAQPTE
jgi:hypothetical protein